MMQMSGRILLRRSHNAARQYMSAPAKRPTQLTAAAYNNLQIPARLDTSTVDKSNGIPMNISELTRASVLSTQQRRTFTTAYGGIPSDGKNNHHLLTLIPYKSTLKDGRHVEVDFFRHSPNNIEECEWFAGMALMNLVIREGKSWPFDEDFKSVDDWRGYFLSHTAFVVRALDNGMDFAKRNSSSQGEILGCFYIKPNFPGRCSHVCNGGFITAPRFRGLGIGRLMGNVFLRAAKDLGFRSSYFNLVFKSNPGSVHLWESLGFERVATLENAARLEGLEEGELDTAYGYWYDLETLPADYLGPKKKDGVRT